MRGPTWPICKYIIIIRGLWVANFDVGSGSGRVTKKIRRSGSGRVVRKIYGSGRAINFLLISAGY